MSTGTDDRAAAIGTLTATLNARLAEDEAVANDATYERPSWRFDINGVHQLDGLRIAEPHSWYLAAHIARNDPASVLRRVKAIRDLLAAILAEPHDYIPGDEFYSCSQAVDPGEDDPGEKYPGSGCSDEDRAGQPCDCGRDARVERLLRILAGVYEEQGERR